MVKSIDWPTSALKRFTVTIKHTSNRIIQCILQFKNLFLKSENRFNAYIKSEVYASF